MTKKKSWNWKAISSFILDLVRALRGGPGRFYSYTFAAGIVLLTGMAWWEPFAEFLAQKAVEQFADDGTQQAAIDPTNLPSWAVSVFGFVICLGSMYGFHKAITTKGITVDDMEGYVAVEIPEGQLLRDGLDWLCETSEKPINYENVDRDLLDMPIKPGRYEWPSLNDALEGLHLLVAGGLPEKIFVNCEKGGFRLAQEQKEHVEHL